MFAEQLHADRPQSFAERGGSSPPVPRDTLLARYNLELARGMLRDALRVELLARGGWRDVFRAVKAAGLMHALVRSGKRYQLLRTGPAAAFLVRPSRYGVRFARVLPVLARALGWRVRAGWRVRPDGACARMARAPGWRVRPDGACAPSSCATFVHPPGRHISAGCSRGNARRCDGRCGVSAGLHAATHRWS